MLQYPLKGAIMASYSISTRQKDKGWQVIVSYKDRYGKWRQKSKQGFATKRQAKDYGDVIVKDIKENLLLTNNEELANMTFIEFTRLYFDDVKDSLRPNTILAYQNSIKHLHKLHHIKMKEITPQMVRSVARESTLSDSTKHYVFGQLKAIFTHAITQYNLVSKNPVSLTIKKTPVRKKLKIITPAELSSYYSCVDPTSIYCLAVKILQYTGMRIGELLGLTWEDIDFEQSSISINKQWVLLSQKRNYGFGELKTKNSTRIIPIPNQLLELLKECKATVTTDRIIPIRSPSTLQTHIAYYISGHSPHDFRHTYATTLLANGVDIKTVATLLGDTVTTIINTYIHYSDEMRDNARSDIQRIFG